MTTSFRVLRTVVVGVLLATAAAAQTTPNASSETARPAFGTAQGDTGLWYVPTAEVLAKGKWSASGYRTSVNYTPGFSNAANFPLNFGVGVFRGAELFASFIPVSRVERDLRPLFLVSPDSPEVGGPVPRYPYASKAFSGSQVGDMMVGLKVGLLSEERQQPVALAVRGSFKLPTGDKDAGVSTGKVDTFLDLVVSKDVKLKTELSAFTGGTFRSSTDEVTQSKGLRWGVGAGFPSHSKLRLTAELYGEQPFDDTIVLSTPIVGEDKSSASGSYPLKNSSAATLGLTWQTPSGVFFGIGMTKSFSGMSRDGFSTDSDPSSDFLDYQIRIGFHPGAPRSVAPAPAPPPPPAPPTAATPPPPPPPAAPANRAPAPAPAPAAPRPVVQLNFEDVYFDFDRSTLRPDALRLLDDAVTKLQANPDKNVIIEGHTCNIGTAEYNLALGERRARSVYDYLTSRGVPASRLETRSYGEEEPKYDNAREETRRMNRRASLVVKVQ